MADTNASMLDSTPHKRDSITTDTEKATQPKEYFPEGGARAWSVVLGAAGLTFCTLGYINAFGVFQTYYETHQLSHKSPSDISWIGSLQVFLLFSSMVIGGPLFDRYGPIVIWPPTITYILSIMMTSLCSEYYQFMLAQGLLGGLSIGLTVSPALAAAGQSFQQRRALAMGATVAGSSVGGVIFPIMLEQLLAKPSLGFGWTIRICGFLILAIMVPSALAIRARLPSRRNQFFLPVAFKSPMFLLLGASGGVLLIGFFVPSFFLPTFALAHGTNAQLSYYLIAIFNGASFFGRVGPGLLADRFGRINVYFAAAISSTVLAFCWQAMTSTGAVIAFAVLYGIFSGAVISMFATALSLAAPNPQSIGAYIGMGMGMASVAALIGPPVGGVIVTGSGFGAVADFSGAASAAGAICIVLAKLKSGRGLWSRY